MLKMITSMKDLNIRQLLDVYCESIINDSHSKKESVPLGVCVIEAEQDFLNYMRDFFTFPGAFLELWELDGVYLAALRAEAYNDGYLISGLETMPAQRRRGYARDLLKGVISYLGRCNNVKIYSHVKKKNTASLELHFACGFSAVSEYAVLLDGSVSTDYYTLCYSR